MGIITNWLNAMGGRKANKTNLQIARETNQTNLQLAREQNQWNLEQWNRQNEYNTPLNQVNLLKQAGLNPNLYKGEGSTAGSLVSADLANQQAATVTNPFAGMEHMNIAKDIADISNTIANTKKTVTDAKLNETRNVNEMTAGKFIEALNKSQLDMNNSTVSLNKAMKFKTDAETDVFKKRLVEMDKNIEYMDSQIQKNGADIALTNKSIDKIDQELKIQWAHLNLAAEELAAQKELWETTKQHMRAQMKVYEGQAEQLTIANALSNCTFMADVEGRQVEVQAAKEGVRHVKVMNRMAEDAYPIQTAVGIVSNFLGSLGGAMIGVSALRKGFTPQQAAGYSLMNPSSSTSVAMP